MRADASSRADFVRRLVPQTEIDRFLQSIDGFQPINDRQREILKSTATGTVVLGGNRCISGDTVVSTDGRRVDEIDDAFECYSLAGNTVVKAQAQAPFLKGMADLYLLRLANGSYVKGTLGHRVLTSSGFRAISSILDGRMDVLIVSPSAYGEPAPSNSLVPVLDVSLLEKDAPYYDFHVPVLNNYISNGVVSHNSGKTKIGGAETVYRLLGNHPYKQTHKPPIKVWCCSQDLPGVVKAKGDDEQEVHKQLEQLKMLIPPRALKGGSWATAFSPTEHRVDLVNKSVVLFKSYSQGPLAFESDAIMYSWLDEEPPDKTIWTSTLMRLIDFSGQWMMTATPILSLEGKGWIEELWDNRMKPGCPYVVHQLFTRENTTLSKATIEASFANLSDEERQVREYGAFARVGGKVLSEFKPDVHLIDGFIPPADWRHYIIIDPGGRNATAALFAAVDPDGVIYLYAEYYEKDRLPGDHIISIDAIVRALNVPWETVETIIDSSAWDIERTLAQGKLDRSLRQEYQMQADLLDAKWFRPNKSNKADVFAWRVKRYFKSSKLFVMKHLHWWQWEAERWTYPKGTRSFEMNHGLPEQPVNKDNHLMDCTRYLVNELPDPLEEDTKKPIENTPEWRAMKDIERAAKQVFHRGRGPLGSEW